MTNLIILWLSYTNGASLMGVTYYSPKTNAVQAQYRSNQGKAYWRSIGTNTPSVIGTNTLLLVPPSGFNAIIRLNQVQ